jgi:protein farnesyltransferase/geranylgeranyltransferase type-1 subunit alpha
MSSYIPLSHREQWADITPIPQDDGPDPLVPIMYSTECELPRWHAAVTLLIRLDRDAMDHFRAISLAKEHSERALELTEAIIRMNPAHYTVWYVLEFRKSDS